jgi:hypothetical protein
VEEEGPAGGTDLAAAGRASTRWGQEDGTAAGTAGAGGRPCQDAALGEGEEGACSSSRAGQLAIRQLMAGTTLGRSDGGALHTC